MVDTAEKLLLGLKFENPVFHDGRWLMLGEGDPKNGYKKYWTVLVGQEGKKQALKDLMETYHELTKVIT